jgi:hypothetical protein
VKCASYANHTWNTSGSNVDITLWRRKNEYPCVTVETVEFPNDATLSSTNLGTLTQPRFHILLGFLLFLCYFSRSLHENNKSSNLNSTVLQITPGINSCPEGYIIHPKPRSAFQYLTHAIYQQVMVGSSHFARITASALYTFLSFVLPTTHSGFSHWLSQGHVYGVLSSFSQQL